MVKSNDVSITSHRSQLIQLTTLQDDGGRKGATGEMRSNLMGIINVALSDDFIVCVVLMELFVERRQVYSQAFSVSFLNLSQFAVVYLQTHSSLCQLYSISPNMSPQEPQEYYNESTRVVSIHSLDTIVV